MRYRHRLSRVGRRGLARAAHDPGLRPERSRPSGVHPKLLACRVRSLVLDRPGTSTMLHGMISTGPEHNRIYFGYGTNGGGILQIVDREKLLNGPKEPTPENLQYPQVGRLDLSPLIGAHTTYPMLGVPVPAFLHDKTGAKRDFVMIVNEQIQNECQEARQMVWFADITVEAKGMVVSELHTAPESGGNFCERGGRGSARTRRMKAFPPCSATSWRRFRTSMAACGRWTSAIRSNRGRSGISFLRSRRTPMSGASRSMAKTAARWRSRPTTWKPTIEVLSISSIAPIPGCTFWR